MSLFRKKPVIIEARRFDSLEWNDALLLWIEAHGGHGYATPSAIAIETLEGTMHAVVGDWIIKGVASEFYPCKPDIFEATYEASEAEVERAAEFIDGVGVYGINGDRIWNDDSRELARGVFNAARGAGPVWTATPPGSALHISGGVNWEEVPADDGPIGGAIPIPIDAALVAAHERLVAIALEFHSHRFDEVRAPDDMLSELGGALASLKAQQMTLRALASSKKGGAR